MSRNFDIEMTPCTEHDVAATEMLHEHVKDHQQQYGPNQCATFGQVLFASDGEVRVRGRLFTGDVARYLNKHLKIAVKMQDEVETS